MNTYLTTALYDIAKKYPMPKEHDNKIKYCRVLADGSSAFYYDDNYEFICEIEKAKGLSE